VPAYLFSTSSPENWNVARLRQRPPREAILRKRKKSCCNCFLSMTREIGIQHVQGDVDAKGVAHFSAGAERTLPDLEPGLRQCILEEPLVLARRAFLPMTAPAFSGGGGVRLNPS